MSAFLGTFSPEVLLDSKHFLDSNFLVEFKCGIMLTEEMIHGTWTLLPVLGLCPLSAFLHTLYLLESHEQVNMALAPTP